MTLLPFRDDNKRPARADRRRSVQKLRLFVFPVARSGTAEPVLCYPVETELRKSRWRCELLFCCVETGTTSTNRKILPAVVSERFVRSRHLVRVFLLLDRVAAFVRGIHDLAGQLVHHCLLAAAVGVRD